MKKTILFASLFLFSFPALSHDNDFVGSCNVALLELAKRNEKIIDYAKFFKKYARRGRLDDERIVADEKGNRAGNFWVVAVEPEEKEELGLPSLFYFHPSINVLILPSHGYTQFFFSLGLLHELVHARDKLELREPNNPSEGKYYDGELKAYGVEFDAINSATQGRFNEQIMKSIAQKKLVSVHGLIMPNDESEDALDRTTVSPFARSDNERSLRRAIYTIAIQFEIGRTRENKIISLKKLHKIFGHRSLRSK